MEGEGDLQEQACCALGKWDAALRGRQAVGSSGSHASKSHCEMEGVGQCLQNNDMQLLLKGAAVDSGLGPRYSRPVLRP